MKNNEMKEKIIEQKFVEAVREQGGQALKFVSPGLDGVPDRIVLLPGGKCFFAELKAPGAKPRKLQGHRIAMLRRLGFRVEVIDDPAQIPSALSRAGLDGSRSYPEFGPRVVTLPKPYRMPAPAEDASPGPDPQGSDPGVPDAGRPGGAPRRCGPGAARGSGETERSVP